MKTQLVNYNLNITPKVNYPLVNNSPRFATPALKQDVFTKSAPFKEVHFGRSLQAQIKYFPRIFTELEGITPGNLAKISKKEVKNMSTVANYFVDKKVARDVLKATKILKDSLDKKYGAGKYVFVSIGQSPALLAEMLKMMGAETAICPISELRDGNFSEEILKNPNLGKYFEYLKKIGIGSDEIKTSDKQYIFTDYIYRGDSLKNFKQVLTDPKSGYGLPNVNFVPLQDLLAQDSMAKSDKSFMEQFIKMHIRHTKLKKYSPIFRLPYKDIHLVQEYRDKTPANISFNMLKFAVLKQMQDENQAPQNLLQRLKDFANSFMCKILYKFNI